MEDLYLQKIILGDESYTEFIVHIAVEKRGMYWRGVRIF